MDFLKKLAALREERARLTASRRALIEKAEAETRDLSEPENAEYAVADARAKVLDGEILRFEGLIEEERKIATQKVSAKETQSKRGAYGENAVRMRYRSLAGFKDEESAYRMGMWTRAAVYGDKNAEGWCTDKGMDTRAMSEAVFSKGGALVPEEMSQVIIDLREEYGLARRMLRVVPMGSDTLIVPRRASGLTAYFVGEGVAPTESDKSWNTVQLVAKKLAALTRLSRELAEDAVIDVAADLAQEMAYAFAVKEDDCWINGDGTSSFGGIVGLRPKIITGGLAGAVSAAATRDTFSEIQNSDLLSLMGILPIYASKTARWVASKRAKALVFDALALAAGGNTIAMVGSKPVASYYGDPIELTQAMPSVTSTLANVAMLLYGDFSMASTMGDRRGFSVQVLQERYAELGQIGILGWERFDIVNHDLGDTVTAGPVVALIGA